LFYVLETKNIKTLTDSELVDPQVYNLWAARINASSVSIDDICLLLGSSRLSEAALRCAMLSMEALRWDLVNSYLREARLRSGIKDVRIAISVYEGLRELDLSRLEGRVNSLDGPATVIKVFEDALQRFEDLPVRRPFTLEQEFHALLGIANVHHKRRSWDEALTYASKAVGLAKTLEVPQLVTKARAVIVNLLTNAGRFMEAQAENLRILAEHPPESAPYRNLTLDAELKFRFGFFNEALEVAQSTQIPLEDRLRITDFYALLLGRFDPGKTPTVRNKFVPLLGGVRELVALNGAVPNSANEVAVVRNAAAIMRSLPTLSEFPSSAEKALDTLVRVKAKLITGEYSLAAAICARYKDETREKDILVALGMALKVEVCLHIHADRHVSFAESVHHLRDVVDAFEKYSFASGAGLARFLMYWTPITAAFLTVIPEAPPHFAEARHSILRTQKGNAFVYNTQIPNVVAIEQVLLGFGLNLRLHAIDTPNLNERQKSQRDRLLIQNGEAPYWRPVISMGLVAYGLMRLALETGEVRYQMLARALYEQYGLFPKTSAQFATSLQEAIRAAYQRLFDGMTTLDGFVDEVSRLRG
jgi:tetratricopeptide (TPR) repeat protein